ncbi:hypothetical protein CTI12_AA521800 [Artemisia annua]|uniref:DNA helicase Pif1-like 2B domain-containing protein n=1 Tax=Artemisia annua TaxID=35608 RepID=A0A2U1L7C1_ARTAN|nr:hypothetical protein CTI12_AA521800 [Artemisia annua]
MKTKQKTIRRTRSVSDFVSSDLSPAFEPIYCPNQPLKRKYPSSEGNLLTTSSTNSTKKIRTTNFPVDQPEAEFISGSLSVNGCLACSCDTHDPCSSSMSCQCQHRRSNAPNSSDLQEKYMHNRNPVNADPPTGHTTSSTGKRKRHSRITAASPPTQIQGAKVINNSTGSNSRGKRPRFIQGTCNQVCKHCKALFWYEERIKSSKRASPEYHRCCNNGKMFAMTSLGAEIDDSINRGRGPYVFKVSGRIYHYIGSMCPELNKRPKFLQHIYDTVNEVDNRLRHFKNSDGRLRREVVEDLISILDEHNELVKLFRTARDKIESGDISNFKLKLFGVVGSRQYDIPAGDSIGAIVFEGGPEVKTDYDVVIERRGGQPQRIDKLNPHYMSLHFPLLHIHGEEGYHLGLKLLDKAGEPPEKDKHMTMKMYYAYQLHDRLNQFSLLKRDMINSKVLDMLQGDSHAFNSNDEALPKTNDGGAIELLYPVEYLNTLKFPGLPPHTLILKIGAPIILLRNLNLAGGMCNGTRMIVTQILSKIIEARIVTGTRMSQKVFIPRILLIERDERLPFVFKRKQFPIKLCYAMTINKSQGQSLNNIGIYLPEPIFGHGQLYVALSRSTSPEGLKILIENQPGKDPNTTKNIVYKDFLSQVKITQANGWDF